MLSKASLPDAAVFTCAYIAAGIAWVIAIWAQSRSSSSIPIWLIIVAAIVFRIALIPFGPLFDDDVYRYLWDGHVAATGMNPFMYPPSQLHSMSAGFPYFNKIGYPEIRTIYPPVAQVLFLLAAKLNLSSPILFKLILIPFDLGIMLLLSRMLKLLSKPSGLILVYAWSPLVLKEFYNSAHVDIVMMFFMACALYLAIRARPSAAGIFLALGVATKGAAVIIGPVLLKHHKLRDIIPALIVLAAVFLPYASVGGKMLSGATAYAHYWRFNDGAFYILYCAEQLCRPRECPTAPFAKAAAAIIFVAYATAVLRRKEGRMERITADCLCIIAAMLLLMPAVNPWYVCWVLPLLCLSPNSAVIALCALCPLSYLYYQGNSFPNWIRIVEYLPVYALLVYRYISCHSARQ